MQIKVNVNNICQDTSDVLNENEYNIHELNFNFSEEYSNDLVKVALFTKKTATYKVIIANDKCSIPPEILEDKGEFILGVYAYQVDNEELILRYSPAPIKLFVSNGSYIKDEDTENSEPITPSELEQYQQALQEGLSEVNGKLSEIDAAIEAVNQAVEDVDNAVERTNNLDLDANKVEHTTTVTITKKDGTTKSVQILDGQDYVITQQDYQEIANIVEQQVEVPTKTSDLINDNGFIDNSVDDLINYTLTTQTGSKIELEINSSNYQLTAKLKDKNNNLVSTSNVIDLPIESMVVNASYSNGILTLTLQNGNTLSVDISDIVSGLVSETDFEALELRVETAENNINSIQNIITAPYDLVKIHNMTNSADCCFVENQIWFFSGGSDDHTTQGYVGKYNFDFDTCELTLDTIIRHNLGHVNTVSYCEENDTLICGNGGQQYGTQGQIYILPNVSQKDVLNYSDCIVINVNFGDKIQAFWGENNNGVNNIIYVIANDNKYYGKLLLTQDNNGDFTGEYTVLDSATTTETTAVNQGSTFYNGVIYHNIGHTTGVIAKCVLNNGAIYREFIRPKYYNADGTELSNCYGQGITIKDDVLVQACVDKVRIYKLHRDNYLKITELEEKIAEQQNIINQLPKVEGEGTSVTLNDTISAQMAQFDIKGNSTQTGTPTLQNPIPIFSSGDINNLYNKSDNTDSYYLTSEGVETSNNAWALSDYIPVSDTIVYSGLTSVGTAPYSAWYNSSKTFISSFKQQTGENTLTIPANAKYVRFSIRAIDVDSFSVKPTKKVINEKIENSDGTQSQTYTIPCQQPMRSIGTVRDEFLKVNGVWKERHNIGIYVINGTEGFVRVNNSFQTGSIVPSDIALRTSGDFALSTCFKYAYYASGITSSIQDNEISWSGAKKLTIGSSETNVDTFISTLAEKKPEVIYILDAPIDLTCTAEQVAILETLPYSYKEQTNISSLDVTPVYIEAKAILDLSSLIN